MSCSDLVAIELSSSGCRTLCLPHMLEFELVTLPLFYGLSS